MINAGYYILEKLHGQPATWTTIGAIQSYSTSTGEVIRNDAPHSIPRGLLCKDTVTAFERITTSLIEVNSSYDKTAKVFLIRQSYLPPKYDASQPSTNVRLTIAGLTYKVNELSISDGIVFLKISRA
jgi:hypothetical protein